MAVTIDEAIILTEIGTPKNRSTPNTTNNITVVTAILIFTSYSTLTPVKSSYILIICATTIKIPETGIPHIQVFLEYQEVLNTLPLLTLPA